MDQPEVSAVLRSMLRARRLRPPRPTGARGFDSDGLCPVLHAVEEGGVAALSSMAAELRGYLDHLASIDPDDSNPAGAKAFWINLYNTGALDLARRSWDAGAETVLRLPGAFDHPFVTIAGETLSLDGIEHGKVRRFGDPRIHAALVCGSASCPTLAFEPYRAEDIEDQLDRQMRRFLVDGGAIADRAQHTLTLSRLFLWYGGDFVRPRQMPTLLPASRRALRRAVLTWMPRDLAAWVRTTHPRLRFADYDWGLSCAVR